MSSTGTAISTLERPSNETFPHDIYKRGVRSEDKIDLSMPSCMIGHELPPAYQIWGTWNPSYGLTASFAAKNAPRNKCR